MNIIKNSKAIFNVAKQFTIDYAPQILMGAGVVSSVGAFGWGIKQARSEKNDQILNEYRVDIAYVNQAQVAGESIVVERNGREKEFSGSALNGFKAGRAVRMIGKYVVLYSGPIALEVLSIAAFCKAFGIQTKRLAAVSALYSYYKDVAEKLEKERTGEQVVDEETGEVKEIEVQPVDTEFANPYAFRFDETYNAFCNTGNDETDNWINFQTCAKLEQDWNHILEDRDIIGADGQVIKYGKVYLNEIRRAFGVNHRDPRLAYGYGDPDCEMGQIVGWDRAMGGDAVRIDLGFRKDADFVAGRKTECVIQPNCCGIINDLLKGGK